MNRYLVLFFLVIVVVLALVFFTEPQLLDKIWMWLVGFIGYIILLIEKGAEGLKELFTSRKPATEKEKPTDPVPTPTPQPPVNWEEKIKKIEERLKEERPLTIPLSKNYVTLLRYKDDGQTTLGLLFIHNRFFAYTLEDTHRDEKKDGNTRIPQGTYPLELNRNLTDLTQRYRNMFSWFDFHIEIKEIPNYNLVYIHIGNTHQDTRGCVLVADGITDSSTQSMITYSRLAFERLYKTLRPLLNENQAPISIQILNEDWFEKVHVLSEKEIAVPST
ncbi:DUF5675 family protein [Pleomorphovibrio marinus]|uniref:DUF5675 family protein n=1 Tax=Pleomorphovibrio marinus TaxID=2164132 RepID=UPI000E0A8E49|nr:DUF5675 family protein [Pleomorphovibrio marinus]